MKFTIDTVPTPQARARHTRTGRTYKAPNQKDNERTIEALLIEHRPPEPMAGPLSVEIVAHLPIPKSKPKRWQAEAQAGEQWPVKKPDVDNLAKQLLDAMTRLRFWSDDVQVCALTVIKRYSIRPAWEVEVEEIATRSTHTN
jgi:Holliday junction resolvase RusA-like endonuclease